MCDVTLENFDVLLPAIETALKSARFVAIDVEFSCLTASRKLERSLFDTASERYRKVKSTVQQMIPVQIGLTAFTFNSDDYSYMGHSYNFYIFPASYKILDKKFLCQSSSFKFLAEYGFDFNKMVYQGIPYVNNEQEELLTSCIREHSGLDLSISNITENLLEEQSKLVTTWFFKAKDGDTLVLNKISEYKGDIIYVLHKRLRGRFNNHLWTCIVNKQFTVQKVDPATYKVLASKCDIEKQLISYTLGFTKVFRLLKSVKTPLIGHNVLIDLMVLIQHLENPLPKSYKSFKTLVHAIFPIIYDTKHISFDVYFAIAESKRWQHNILEDLYAYFKDGIGRHLALNSPAIEATGISPQRFHSAGWDSYCTGYIFIRMAHMYATQNFPNIRGKKFVSNELLHAVSQFRNKVNVIRADVSYICLDNDDPHSQRPPPFIIESVTSDPVNINQVTSILSSYGFVEVKPHSYKGRRVIVAVDNFGSAKRILQQFSSRPDYTIQQYSTLKHSPVVRNILWSGVIVSGAVLACLGYLRLANTR